METVENKIAEEYKRNIIYSYLASNCSNSIREAFLIENPSLINEHSYLLFELKNLLCINDYKNAISLLKSFTKSTLIIEILTYIKFLHLEELKKETTINNLLSYINSEFSNDEFDYISREELSSSLFDNSNLNIKEKLERVINSNIPCLETNIKLISENKIMIESSKKIKLENINKLEIHEDEVSNLVFSYCNNYFLSVTKGKSVACFKIEHDKFINKEVEFKLISINTYHTSDITSVCWSSHSKFILTTGKDKCIKIINPFNGKIIQTLKLKQWYNS